MMIECAWCSRVYGEKDGLGTPGTTSGICSECFAVISLEIVPMDGFEAAPEPVAGTRRG